MSTSLQLREVRGRVDYGIITIRADEFTAVFERLPERSTVKGGRRLYEFSSVPVIGGGERGVAIVRCPSQGENIAQSVTGDMIRDLQPRILLLVGIAGGVPSDDFSLGDVLLASRLHDFSVTAALQNGTSQLNVGGGPVHKIVENLLAHLPALLHRMPKWNASESIGHDVPDVKIPEDINATEVYGPDSWKSRVIETLKRHFAPDHVRRAPLAYVGPTASSNQLVKDADLVQQWQEAARSVTHIEMELAGVVQAARDADGGEVPVIAIRGLSDIVGFRRDSDWTGYACHSAASFCFEIIRSKIIEEATPWDWNAPSLMHSKVANVNEWLGGAREVPQVESEAGPTSTVSPPRETAVHSQLAKGILILGPGGVGKTTLGSILSGKEERSPLVPPPVYNESITLEQFQFLREDGTEAIILVPPGQEHRRQRDWQALYTGLSQGRYHGIIFLAAYGYHSLGQISWKQHTLYKTLKKKAVAEFMEAYLKRQQDEELSVLKEMMPHIKACPSNLWLMTLVGKQDLWYSDRENVIEHYTNGKYAKQIRDLVRTKGNDIFKHELVEASLIISNFVSSVGEKLALNQAGYDRDLQVKSLRRLVEVFDKLRCWERG